MVAKLPAADAHAVVKRLAARFYVLLGEYVFADNPVGVALAGDKADKVENAVFCGGEFAAVFYVVPNAEHNCQKFVARLLEVAVHVPAAAGFNPPVAEIEVARVERAVEQVFGLNLYRPFRGGVGNGSVAFDGRKH